MIRYAAFVRVSGVERQAVRDKERDGMTILHRVGTLALVLLLTAALRMISIVLYMKQTYSRGARVGGPRSWRRQAS
jgi:hypothetical protein